MVDYNEHFKQNMDEINSSIMEIASDLAVARLFLNHPTLVWGDFIEPDDLEKPDAGTHYKPEYQEQYNESYDEEYDRIARVFKFENSKTR